MKKIVVVLIAILSILFTGCSYDLAIKSNHTFTGGNENWSGEYTTKYTATFPKENGKTYCKKIDDHVLVVTYKNDLSELSDVKNILISYKTSPQNGGSLREDSDSAPTHKKYYLGGASGEKFQLSNGFDPFENFQGSVSAFCGPSPDILKAQKIKVTVNLEGKSETFYLTLNDNPKPGFQLYNQIKTLLSPRQNHDIFSE